jgi:hypothetical protein
MIFRDYPLGNFGIAFVPQPHFTPEQLKACQRSYKRQHINEMGERALPIWSRTEQPQEKRKEYRITRGPIGVDSRAWMGVGNHPADVQIRY